MSQTNNKYKRLEALLSEAKPADPNPIIQPANGEMDALKARLASLEAEIEENRTKPQSSAISFDPAPIALEAKPVTQQAATTKDQTQTTKKSQGRFFSAPVFTDDAEKTRTAK